MEYKCRYEYKKPIRDRACEVDYVWNPTMYDCECDKDCEIDEYLKEMRKNSY